MAKQVNSFRSYYNSFAQNGHKKDISSGDHLEVPEIQPDIKILPQLLRGEEVIARAQGVHIFQPLSVNNQGLIGELYVTNFKLSFQTITFPEYRREHYADVQDFWHPWARGLVDIPLSSISGLFRVSKNGKRKPFKIGPLKRILVVTKNFRLETFSFLQSSTVDSHGVASALAGYVLPSEKERLFVFSRDGSRKDDESPRKNSHVLFSQRNDWIQELNRLRCREEDWKICQANEDFHICQNLPKCFVVPAALGDDGQLETLCLQLSAADDRRPLIWTWSSPASDAALCRMSGDVLDETMVNAVQRAHPRKQAPRVLEMGTLCPNIKEVKKSFETWRDSFLVESTAILEETDDKWFTAVETSRWLYSVSRCLDATRMAVLEIRQCVSVILKEVGDRDLNCLVSALAQLCLDSSCRTLSGFQRLIEKEFVALGHRFQERLALVKTDTEKEAPVFLLFLDCVFQLTMQYPASFEFTDVYLILVYDSCLMGAFRNFSMTCQRDVLGSRKGATTSSYPDFWLQDFSHKSHLKNPLFHTFTVLQHVQAPTGPIVPCLPDILEPNPALPFLTIWYHCYFRYIPPLATRGAVDAKVDKSLHGLCSDVESLCRQVGVSSGLHFIREDDGVSVDGDSIQRETDGRQAAVVTIGSGNGHHVTTGGSVDVRRRNQLLRSFTPQNPSNHALITFQK